MSRYKAFNNADIYMDMLRFQEFEIKKQINKFEIKRVTSLSLAATVSAVCLWSTEENTL